MSDQPHNPIAQRIMQRLNETGRTAAEVSKACGFGQDFIRDFITGRKKKMNADALARIATELGTTVPWLQGDEDAPKEAQHPVTIPGRTIPVYGTAAGAQEGALHVSTTVIEWIPCPSGLAGVRDAYALYVVGESMVPRFRHGDIIFVAPHRQVRSGDDVVLQVRHSESDATEAWVKEFVRYHEEELVTRQYNPAGEKIFLRNDVVEMHRVMSINELIGV